MTPETLPHARSATTRRRGLLRLAAAAVLALSAATAAAQASYPSRPIRMIVPFSVGTGIDVVARGLAQQLSLQMGTSVVVENRDSVGGVIGAAAVQAAAPDGYTLLFAVNPPLVIQPSLQAKASYDADRFTPIAKVGSVPTSLVISGKSRFRTFEEAAAHAEQNPGKMTYAHTGTGTITYLAMEALLKERGIRVLEVPYKNAAQSLVDTISGTVDLAMRALPGVVALAQSGEVRLLAVGSPARIPALRDVPTMAEVLKRPGFEASVWYGVLGPPGMDPAHVRKLNAEIRAAVNSPPMKELFAKASVDAAATTPEQFATQLAQETVSFRKLVQELGVRPQ